jgi:hypothetical protein
VAAFLATMALFWATWRLVKGADKTAECQLRAYVGIADHKLSGFAENQIPKIILHIKNFGQTPARKLQYWAASGFASYPLNTQLPLQSFRPETISIFPSDNFSPVITLAQPLNSADMAGLQSGNRRLYVYGHIKYEDVFGQTRNTGFRLMYGGADNLSIGRMLWAEAGSYDD